MDLDEATPLPTWNARPRQGIDNRKPIKGSKVRGSIFSGNHPNKISVFEDPGPQLKATLAFCYDESQAKQDVVQRDRMKELETTVKNLARGNARTALDIKTLADRVSTTEANFVELKYEVLLSNKPSPFTPAKSRTLVHTPISSPANCPSLTGAEENTTFASPPVPALQRRLLQMSARGKAEGEVKKGSGLRYESSFSFSDESMLVEEDYLETLQDEGLDEEEVEAGETTPKRREDSSKRASHPPPAFDPEASLGDVSIIEGIEDDVGRAEEYLSDGVTMGPVSAAELGKAGSDVLPIDSGPEASPAPASETERGQGFSGCADNDQSKKADIADLPTVKTISPLDDLPEQGISVANNKDADIILHQLPEAAIAASMQAVLAPLDAIGESLTKTNAPDHAKISVQHTDASTQTDVEDAVRDAPRVPVKVDCTAQTLLAELYTHVACQFDPSQMEQLTVRVGQLEEQADTSIHDQVTAAFNELAGDYRDLWREERAKRLGLEEKVQKLASEAAVAPGLSVAQTDEKKFDQAAPQSKWTLDARLAFSHLFFAIICILGMRFGGS